MRAPSISRDPLKQPPRSGVAVAAQRRNSAGPMRDRRLRRPGEAKRRVLAAALWGDG